MAFGAEDRQVTIAPRLDWRSQNCICQLSRYHIAKADDRTMALFHGILLLVENILACKPLDWRGLIQWRKTMTALPQTPCQIHPIETNCFQVLLGFESHPARSLSNPLK